MAVLCDCRSFIFARLSGQQDYGVEPSHFPRALSLGSYLQEEEKSKIQNDHHEYSDYWYKMVTLALGTGTQNQWVPIATSHSRYVLGNRVCPEKGTSGNLVVMWTLYLCNDYSLIPLDHIQQKPFQLCHLYFTEMKNDYFFLSTCLYGYLFHL